jgi:hypothetical protein
MAQVQALMAALSAFNGAPFVAKRHKALGGGAAPAPLIDDAIAAPVAPNTTAVAILEPVVAVVTDPKCVARAALPGAVIKGVVSCTAPALPEGFAPRRDLVLALDVSGSMAYNNKLESLVQAVKWVVVDARPGDRICLISFDHEVQKLTAFVRCTEDGKKQLLDACASLESGGGTDIKGALEAVSAALAQRAERNPVTQVILISDGQDEAAKMQLMRRTLRLDSLAAAASLACLGLGADHDAELLNKVCELGRGMFVFADTADKVSCARCAHSKLYPKAAWRSWLGAHAAFG